MKKVIVHATFFMFEPKPTACSAQVLPNSNLIPVPHGFVWFGCRKSCISILAAISGEQGGYRQEISAPLPLGLPKINLHLCFLLITQARVEKFLSYPFLIGPIRNQSTLMQVRPTSVRLSHFAVLKHATVLRVHNFTT